jgi:two-component system, OmpR family, phosphate regulon response regulator OmpR
MSEAKKILLLDDEPELCAMLQRYLSEQGLDVRAAANAAHLDKLLVREHFDLLILDLMMPDEDGLSICRRLRVQGETIPIIMLTARGDPVDKIVGLEMGADDYLAKLFNPRELLARVQAQLRRQEMVQQRARITQDEVLHFGDCEINLAARKVTKRGEALTLSSREFDLLRAFVNQPGRPLGRERLMQLAFGDDYSATDRSIDVQVVRLRRLIEDDPTQPRYIQTVWGVGYVFVPDGNAA